MDQDHLLTAADAAADEATFTAQQDGPDSDADATPAEGSDAAASLDFGRNLARLREARGLSHNKLAALADIAADSIREYEQGKYRPKQPKLWSLAKALDVMPIALGPGSTRGGEAPVPVEMLLRKKGGRALRLQRLVELLTEDGLVSAFAQQAGVEPEEVYGVAASEGQLSEEQLEPFLIALPRVRRSWLMSGEGEPLAALAARTPAAAPVETAAPDAGPDVFAARVPGRALTSVFTPAPLALPLAAPSVQALSLTVPAVAGAPMYVPLGLGLVAEVDAVLLSGAGAVCGLRLLAGAGVMPALTSPDQLERLFHALRGVLDQRAAE